MSGIGGGGGGLLHLRPTDREVFAGNIDGVATIIDPSAAPRGFYICRMGVGWPLPNADGKAGAIITATSAPASIVDGVSLLEWRAVDGAFMGIAAGLRVPAGYGLYGRFQGGGIYPDVVVEWRAVA